MFSYSRDLRPKCFDNLFTYNNRIHDHNTRAATILDLDKLLTV